MCAYTCMLQTVHWQTLSAVVVRYFRLSKRLLAHSFTGREPSNGERRLQGLTGHTFGAVRWREPHSLAA